MKQLIFTTYLTGAKDPQRNVYRTANSDGSVGLLADCNRLKVYIKVFYDKLSPKFVKKHTTHYVSFVKIPCSSHSKYSVNDLRFLVYAEWIKDNNVEEYDLWFSDLLDVRMNRSPEIMRENYPEYFLFSGRVLYRRIGGAKSPWLQSKMKEAYGRVSIDLMKKYVLMAGTWGGRYAEASELLSVYVDEIKQVCSWHSKKINCNLAVFNKVAHTCGIPLWVKAEPLHSKFKKYQMKANVCFVHK